MNRVDIRRAFLRLIQQQVREAHSVQVDIDQDELDQLWYEGACELCRLARPVHLRRETTITLEAGVTEYPFPDDFHSFLELEQASIAGTPLTKVTKSDLDRKAEGWRDEDNARRLPVCAYYEAGIATSGDHVGKRIFGVYPVPSGEGTLVLPYSAKPPKLSTLASDTAEYVYIPDEYQRVPGYYGAPLWLQTAGIPTTKDPSWMIDFFSNKAQKFRRDYGEKQQQDYRQTAGIADVWL